MSLNLKVKVNDLTTSVREGIAKSSGKPYKITTQDNVFIEMGGEIRRMPITLPDQTSPYAPGMYILDIEKLLTLNRFDQLEFRPFARYDLTATKANAIPN